MNKKKFTLIEQNIWKHNSEQKYVVDIFLGRDENGKSQRTSKTCYSLADARKTLIYAKAEKVKGVSKTKNKVPSIFELMVDYREIYIERETEKTTSYGYSIIENHIKRFFEETKKNTRIDKITTIVIDQYYTHISNLRSTRLPNGLGSNTIRKHSQYLSQLFQFAIDRSETYCIYTNPVKKSKLPKKRKANTPNLKEFNVNKIIEMLEAIRENGNLSLECAVLIALFVGTRRGETEYLKWSDIELEKGRIEINGCRTSTNTEIIKNSTKNGLTRKTSICNLLVDSLKDYKKWQLKNQVLLGKEYYDSDYVLVKANGKPYSVKWINGAFSKFLKDYGLPHLRYHDLRHLNASILLKFMSVADVGEHLGHTNPYTTMRIYAHSIMEDENDVALGLDKIFKVS